MLSRSYTLLATPRQSNNSSWSQKTHNSTTTVSTSLSTATVRTPQIDRCVTPAVLAPLPSKRDPTADVLSPPLTSLTAARRQQAARPVPGKRPASRVPVIQPGGRMFCRPTGADTDGHRRRTAPAGLGIFYFSSAGNG